MNWKEKDQAYIWHPYTQMAGAPQHILIERAEGAHLFDEEGNCYIDGVSSWWVNVHGHAHPHITKRVSEQLATLEHVIFAGFTHKPAIELSERLLAKLPDNQDKVFFSDNGSTAVEVGLKMAFQYWYNRGNERSKILAFEDAYHGDTFGAMSVSGRSSFTRPFTSLLFDVDFIPVPVGSKERYALRQLEEKLKTGNYAAFIFEPLVQGAGGMVMYKAELLDEMVGLCKKYGVICIADEVMTGFGRTAKMFACEHLKNKPDIFCLSKGLTGGTMALGITTSTDEMYAGFLNDTFSELNRTFFHGHSFTANPVACSAALASMDIFDRAATWHNIERIKQSHESFGKKLKGNPLIKDLRQWGTIIALELDTGSKTSYFNELRDEIYSFFMKRNILLRPLGNVVYIMPPYCIEQDDLNLIYRAIEDLLAHLKDALSIEKVSPDADL